MTVNINFLNAFLLKWPTWGIPSGQRVQADELQSSGVTAGVERSSHQIHARVSCSFIRIVCFYEYSLLEIILECILYILFLKDVLTCMLT